MKHRLLFILAVLFATMQLLANPTTPEPYAALGIGGIDADGAATADVYDLRGLKMLSKGEQLKRLPKGVYIINGKKVMK